MQTSDLDATTASSRRLKDAKRTERRWARPRRPRPAVDGRRCPAGGPVRRRRRRAAGRGGAAAGLPPRRRSEPAPDEADKTDEGPAKAKDGRGDEPARTRRQRASTSREKLRDELFFEDEPRARPLVRQLYRKLDPTMEWAENNYYKLRIAEQTAGLVRVSPFWVDYAKPRRQRPVPVAAPRRRQPQLHRDDVRPVGARPAVRAGQAQGRVRRTAR